MIPRVEGFGDLAQAQEGAEIVQVGETLIFKHKALNAPVLGKQVPLDAVAVLKDATPGKIVLAKCPLYFVEARGHGVGTPRLAPGHVKGLLVAVDVTVIEVRVLVHPHSQSHLPPAPPFVHNDLTALKFRLVAVGHPAQCPNGPVFRQAAKIRPEDGPGFYILRRIKKEFRVHQGHVVGVQQQHFLEG